MSKTHFDPTLHGRTLTTEAPLHGTAYAGGVNGIVASNIVTEVDCRTCIRVMLSPEWHVKFTHSEIESLIA